MAVSIPVIPVSKGLTGLDRNSLKFVKERVSQTIPDLGVDLKRIASSHGKFGDSRYAGE